MVITDGNAFAAPLSFFEGSWTVSSRDFENRRLHAKAYWSDAIEGGWLLVGSPNLSRQALLETAQTGNTELAVVLAPHDPRLPDVPGREWTADDPKRAAAERHAVEATAREKAFAGSFNAWEEKDVIVTSGVPLDALLEYWDGEAWLKLGALVDGRIAVGGDRRPYLIRYTAQSGAVKQAVVHRSEQLRLQRLRPRSTSRAADVVSQLPLDLEGVRVLESVLADLYLLGQLARETDDAQGLRGARPRETVDAGLTKWMPARRDEEPRVPDIYRRAWSNTPDALLALIRGALRLDESQKVDEREVMDESLEVGELDEEPAVDAEEGLEDEQPPVQVPPAVLRRYRTSLVRLLGRGVEFVATTDVPAVAELAFQFVLRLHERIRGLELEVDGELQQLVDQPTLLRQKLDLLHAYLRERAGRDPQCLATSRIHLAECLMARPIWEPLEWERLRRLAYETSSAILASHDFVNRAVEDAGVNPDDLVAVLQSYADRADWTGFFSEAEEHLDSIDFDDRSFPWVAGRAFFSDLLTSPAWWLAGYGAVAGFAERRPYAVVVTNTSPRSAHAQHLLVVDPASSCVHEAFERRADRRWLVRRYAPVSEGTADRMGMIGAEALSEASRTPFRDFEAGTIPEPLIAELLTSVRQLRV